MKHFYTYLLFSIILGSVHCQEINSSNKKYNPKVSSESFYPEESSIIKFDTTISNYKISTSILPVRDSIVVTYSEFYDHKEQKFKTNKIKYREYLAKIDIEGIKSNLHITKFISKYDLTDVFKPNPVNYFIRNIKFISFNKFEFRFDIMFSFLDNKTPDKMIKYFVSLDNNERYIDYPKEYYDSIFASPE